MQDTRSEIALAIIIGSIIVIILSVFTLLFFVLFIKKKRKIQREKEQMRASFDKEILQSQIEIQEQTFSSISQEIHDNVGQILSLVKVQLNIMEEHRQPDKQLLSDAKENISKAMTDLRDIAKGLSSERIRVVGLISTVEQEVQRINRTGSLHIECSIEGREQPINPQKQLILFRVIQECLQNIIKHANASIATILFRYLHEHFEITVSDNGKGFDFDQEQVKYSGLGLHNIFKRLELLSGRVQVASTLKQGTNIQIIIPYD